MDKFEKLKQDPYNSILDWAESKVKLTGRKVFSILALQPISLIMPPISAGKNEIRPNIHILLFSPPGSGKTTLCQIYEKIAYNPFPYESITSAKLESVLHERKKQEFDNVSMMTGDIARIFKDEILIKTLEGILGPEKRVSRLTMVGEKQFDINAVFFGAGLPENITRLIRRGFLQRTFPLVIYHTKDQRRKIVNNVIDEVCTKKIEDGLQDRDIKNHYQSIWDFQMGLDRIKGYIIEDSFKDKIKERHQQLEENLSFPEDLYLIREAHSSFRFLCASAMLNLFNRKIENNLLIPNKKDLDLALDLFDIEMRMKSKILTLDKLMADTKDIKGLYKQIVNDSKLDIINKKLAESMIKGRGKFN